MRYWLQVRPDPLRTSPLCVLSIMLRKDEYLAPEVEEVLLFSEEALLNGSTEGYEDNPDYNGNHWSLN